MIAALQTLEGFAYGTDPVELTRAEGRVRIVKLLTLYNADGSDITGNVLQVTWLDSTTQQSRTVRRFAFTLPNGDSWTFGTLGGSIILGPGRRLELLLGSAPTNGVEYALDYADA